MGRREESSVSFPSSIPLTIRKQDSPFCQFSFFSPFFLAGQVGYVFVLTSSRLLNYHYTLTSHSTRLHTILVRPSLHYTPKTHQSNTFLLPLLDVLSFTVVALNLWKRELGLFTSTGLPFACRHGLFVEERGFMLLFAVPSTQCLEFYGFSRTVFFLLLSVSWSWCCVGADFGACLSSLLFPVSFAFFSLILWTVCARVLACAVVDVVFPEIPV